nr:malate dehydrogenase, cytoplasmic-like [Quercus suber]
MARTFKPLWRIDRGFHVRDSQRLSQLAHMAKYVIVDKGSENAWRLTGVGLLHTSGRFQKIEKEPTKVLVTGVAGKIGYAILQMIARGVLLGLDQPVTLHLFDNIKQADEALNGIKMELTDVAFPLLKGIVIATIDIFEPCKDVNIAVMLGRFPRKEGMERTDMMSKNVSMYMAQASTLGKHAAANYKLTS